MSDFNRAIRSMFRKPMKSILLLCVVTFIGVFMVVGFATKNTNVNLQDNARQAIGASYQLELNMNNRRERLLELSEKLGEKEGEIDGYWQKQTESGQWLTGTDNEFETVFYEDVMKISEVDGISKFNITTLDTAVNPYNFKRIEDKNADQSYDLKGVHLIGNYSSNMDKNFVNGNVELIEGRHITNEDKDVCIISEELAKLNQLNVGDSIQFNDSHDLNKSEVYTANIIGIYKTSKPIPATITGDTYRSENTIFTDLRFPEKPSGHKDDPLFMTATFKVDDVNQYEEVKERILDTDINWERYDLLDDKGNLDTMSSNFNTLEETSNMMIIVITIASFIILTLIFIFWIKTRSKEVAIYMSLGLTKFNIIKQILIEALLVGIVALSISAIASIPVSKIAVNYIVDNQVQQMEEQQIMQQGQVSGYDENAGQSVKGTEVKITPFIYGTSFATILILEVLTVNVAGILIMKKKPKEILSEMS